MNGAALVSVAMMMVNGVGRHRRIDDGRRAADRLVAGRLSAGGGLI
jgi:hypothetical protein